MRKIILVILDYYPAKNEDSPMSEPIELDKVEHLIRHYRGRLKRFRSEKRSLRRYILQNTIQVLEHYLALCTAIDREKDV